MIFIRDNLLFQLHLCIPFPISWTFPGLFSLGKNKKRMHLHYKDIRVKGRLGLGSGIPCKIKKLFSFPRELLIWLHRKDEFLFCLVRISINLKIFYAQGFLSQKLFPFYPQIWSKGRSGLPLASKNSQAFLNLKVHFLTRGIL